MTLNKLRRELARFFRDESGPTATEYAIMLALIVLVAMATIQSIGTKMMNLYTNIDAAIPQS